MPGQPTPGWGIQRVVVRNIHCARCIVCTCKYVSYQTRLAYMAGCIVRKIGMHGLRTPTEG
jgi:hypothetical protein